MLKKLLLKIKIKQIVKEYSRQMEKMLEDACADPSYAGIFMRDYEVKSISLKKKDPNAKKN